MAATGIFDNEEQQENVDPPDYGNESEAESLRKQQNLIDLFNRRVKMIAFSRDQEFVIKSSLLFMFFYKPCADTYKKYGLPTPAEVARDKGILFIHIRVFDPPLDDELKKVGIDEAHRDAIKLNEKLKSGGFTPDPNAPDNANLPAITVFYNSTFLSQNYPVSESMAHETLHRSGVKPQGLLGKIGFSHDLSGYAPYQEFMDNCEKP